MNTAENAMPILVTGGTGKTGSRIVRRLEGQGISARVGSRSATPPFDWKDRATWAPALEGTRAVYISYQPDLAVPGALDDIRAFVAAAETAGVRKLVLLSGRGEEDAQRAEDVVMASGCAWTIVRASWFFQNFSESFLIDAVIDGTVALPVGDVGEPFIDVEDIADVAVAALTQDGHDGQLYELTGPRLMTFADAVGEIGAAAGRPIAFHRIEPEHYAEGMKQAGVPEDMAALVMYLFTTVLDGRNAHLADGVERALGHGPRDFADYAAATAATGIWQAQERA